MRPSHTRWHLYPDAATLAARATRIIQRAAAEAIEARGRFKLVLAGGATPRAVYTQMAKTPQDWGVWEFYFSDERCLPRAAPERNSHMACDTWLQHAPIPPEHIHVIPAELGPDAAARAYTPVVQNALPFDLVLLGLGADGHTASLFPGQAHLDEALVVSVHNAPKPAAERVSLSIQALARTHQVLFLVSGDSKRSAVAAWQQAQDIPAARVVPNTGVDVLVDSAAWAL